MLAEARELIGDFEKKDSPTGHIQFARGELELAQGNLEKAIPLLREGIAYYGPTGDPRVSMAAEALSRAMEQQGNLAEAVEVLQDLENRQLLDMNARLRLAKLYWKTGNGKEAKPIETDLLKRLAYADPDYPILVELQRMQGTQTSNPSSNAPDRP
jgi:tetratricopeptide (TPR) repeat protein